uniref:C3H1-type domain-containing protein n=1 Tax=Noctiluca scintillans TaxID=2966 RepID=A0A7S1F5V8_NOCSC
MWHESYTSVTGTCHTVLALVALLEREGGRRPASAVGVLYSQPGGTLHRETIRAYGGVHSFVEAHSSSFKLESAKKGQRCPTIILRAGTEVDADNEILEPAHAVKAKRSLPACRFHRYGKCLRGDACWYSHEAPPVQVPIFDELEVSRLSASEKRKALRDQLLYYLSDENLQHDRFFHDLTATSDGWVDIPSILDCRRMRLLGATAEEIPEVLRGLTDVELGETEAGVQAVRRMVPPPPLLGERLPPPADTPECSLVERPLTLLRDTGSGWEPLVEDHDRRSFCFVRENTWPVELLQAEFQIIRTSATWKELRSRGGVATRSTAWYVPRGCTCRYTYGDASVGPHGRPEWLDAIESRVLVEACGLERSCWPDCVNVNLYKDDEQNVGWHSDDEGLFRGCEQDCQIISASWGAVRTFEVALKDENHACGRPSIFKRTLKRVQLHPGDLCSMEGLFQKHYSHQLARGVTTGEELPKANERINLTWRRIVNHKSYCPLARESNNA